VTRRAVAAALPLAFTLAACGKDAQRLDTAKIERGIAEGVERDRPRIDVEEVECPERVEIKKGDTFKCLVKGTREGEVSEATVTQVDDNGRVRYEVP
jgi:ABC-type uncharacterized transport system auxiliary subunit